MKRNYFLILIVLFFATTFSFAQITVKFQAPPSWTAVSLYSYGTSEALGAWPGTTLTATNGWYTCTFPESYTSGTLIFNNNNGGEQTIDFPCSSSVCLAPTGTTDANGHYAVAVTPCTSGGITVKIQKPTAWTSVYIYAYVNGAPVIGGWPGVLLTVDSNGWGSYTFDASITAPTIIFNNNSGSQTGDTNVTSSTCFTSDGATVTSVDCSTTTGIQDVKELSLIYPNPIVDKLNFSAVENMKRITIHSLTGETVMSVNQLDKNGSIDVNSLKSGVYFISIDYISGKQKTEKIIKL